MRRLSRNQATLSTMNENGWSSQGYQATDASTPIKSTYSVYWHTQVYTFIDAAMDTGKTGHYPTQLYHPPDLTWSPSRTSAERVGTCSTWTGRCREPWQQQWSSLHRPHMSPDIHIHRIDKSVDTHTCNRYVYMTCTHTPYTHTTGMSPYSTHTQNEEHHSIFPNTHTKWGTPFNIQSSVF